MIVVAEQRLTVAEFLERDDFEEGYIYELIEGDIMKRTSPNFPHQKVSMRLSYYLSDFILPKNLGELVAAPTDIYLDEDTLVVPDLNFIAAHNLHRIHPTGYVDGAPDLIIEILSKGTWQLDRGRKMRLYKKYQVKEYWLVHPVEKSVEVYVLQNGDYEMTSAADEFGEIESSVLVGFKLDVALIFS